MINSGVQFITLLALSDEGAPSFDRELAANLSAPAFACSPDQFPELMAAAINRRDISQRAAERFAPRGQTAAANGWRLLRRVLSRCPTAAVALRLFFESMRNTSYFPSLSAVDVGVDSLIQWV